MHVDNEITKETGNTARCRRWRAKNKGIVNLRRRARYHASDLDRARARVIALELALASARARVKELGPVAPIAPRPIELEDYSF